MSRNVLLLGRSDAVLDQVQAGIEANDVALFVATSIETVRAIIPKYPISTVIVGAGLDLAQRLEMLDYIFNESDTTTVHLKDWASGPEGMVPFVNGVLSIT